MSQETPDRNLKILESLLKTSFLLIDAERLVKKALLEDPIEEKAQELEDKLDVIAQKMLVVNEKINAIPAGGPQVTPPTAEMLEGIKSLTDEVERLTKTVQNVDATIKLATGVINLAAEVAA